MNARLGVDTWNANPGRLEPGGFTFVVSPELSFRRPVFHSSERKFWAQTARGSPEYAEG